MYIYYIYNQYKLTTIYNIYIYTYKYYISLVRNIPTSINRHYTCILNVDVESI